MAMVKCPYCNGSFDRDKEPYEKVKTRYWHKSCYQKKQEDDVKKEIRKMTEKPKEIAELADERQKVISYVYSIGGKEVNFPLVNRQLNSMFDKGMNYKGIYYTLKYCYEVKRMSFSSGKGGIGIVEYLYKEASEYYGRISEAKSKVKDIEINKEYREVKISSPSKDSFCTKEIDLESLFK